jgi:hypothetical protein
MNCGRFVWVAGALGFLLGCSGRYEVGKLSNGGASGSDSAAGGAFINPGVFTGYESGDAGTAGSTLNAGGNGDVAAGGGDSASFAGRADQGAAGFVGNGYEPFGASPSYCGAAIPLIHTATFATPDLVWKRIQLFLLDDASGPQPELPAVTTRQWAGEAAMLALASMGNRPAAGLVRFVNRWLPGSQRASQWASLIGSGSSLRYLMTTDQGQEHGVGVLTDPVLLQQPNLVRRGAYISNNLVCRAVPPPPTGVPSIDSEPKVGTRRMQFDAHTNNPTCHVCHSLIDPFGIGLEHFAPLTGEYSDLDNGLPIDSSSSIELPQSGLISFVDAPDLGGTLASSCEVAQCLIQRLLADAESSAQLPVPGSTDPAAVAEIGFASYQSGHNLRGLIWYLVQSDTFLRAP